MALMLFFTAVLSALPFMPALHSQEATPEVTPRPQHAFSRWPLSTKNLLFMWEHANNFTFEDFESKRAFVCQVVSENGARYGRGLSMDLGGGSFRSRVGESTLSTLFKLTHRFTLECVVTTDKAVQREHGPVAIVSCSKSPDIRNFALLQDDANLQFTLRTSQTAERGLHPPIRIDALVPGKPYHLMISYASGGLAVYVNGARKLAQEVKGDFRNWEPMPLIFGAEHDGKRDWHGKLEGIALYNRTFSTSDALESYKRYEERLKSRKEPERLGLTATLLHKDPIPNAVDIEPDRMALVLYTYEVQKVNFGTYEPKTVKVLHWAILNGKVVQRVRQRPEQRSYELELEDLASHPDLKSLRLLSKLPADEPIYYDTSVQWP